MNSYKSLNKRFAFFLIFIAVVVYLPGLPGGFIYDDYFNFLQNPSINKSTLSFSDAWSASQSGVSGPLGRPLPMLSFYLNYHLSGFYPLSYKLINIAIHALNTLLVFFIICRLLNLMVDRHYLSTANNKIEHLAFWITLLWAVHPINLTAVLYVVQRMTSMAAVFTLLGIYSYINLRETSVLNIGGMISKLIIIIVLGIMAALCKENGLLLFLFLFVIECFFYRWRVNTLQQRWCLIIFYVFVIILPLCFAGYLLFNGELTANYSGRAFDLTQRMLTELRVLWFYILQILLPQANLFGLHHDDFIVSISVIEPISTLWSIIAFILLTFCATKYIRKFPWFGFGLTFFIAGHMMESTILPLNLVHEHRNYLPSLGLIVIFVLALNLILSRVKAVSSNLLFVVITILFAVITINRAYDWSNVVLLGERLAQRHPDSVTSNYEMGYTYAKVFERTGEPVFANTAKIALKKAVSLSDSNMQPAIALAHVSSMLGEAEVPALINKISTHFRHGNISIAEVISLRQFVNCQIEAICSVSETTIQTLFASLLANHDLQGRLRDDVLYIYSTYLVTIPEGAVQALTIMQDIVSRNPNTLEYQVKLISVLLTNEKTNEANLLMDSLTKRYGIKWNVIKE